MSITVKDVAREAGVSRTTVSNVFNRRTKYSEDTRQAVLEAANRLGYKPNLAAKSLITNQSQLIGLILPSYVQPNALTNTPFYNTIMDGVYSVLQDETYDLLISCVPSRARLPLVSDWLDTRNVDGVLALGEFDDSFLQQLDAKSIPVVLVDNYQKGFPNFSYINSDDETGGYLAARKLVERGYRKIAVATVLTGSLKNSPLMRKRCEGYRRAMQEAGLPETVIELTGIPFEAGKQLGAQLLSQGFEAVFCTEDMLAVGVLHHLLEQGVSAGREFGLVGFDNFNIAQQVHPELTTIDQNIYEKGQIAAQTLLEIMKEKGTRKNGENHLAAAKYGPPGTRVILPVKLVERETA